MTPFATWSTRRARRHGLEAQGQSISQRQTSAWRKIKCFEEKEMQIIGAQRERGKATQVIMAEKGLYKGGALVNFNAAERQALWDRVQGKVGGPVPKGHKKEKAEWLKPGLVGWVETLKGEEKLRHARLLDFWEDDANGHA
ncbi:MULTISPECIES: hypothetical protein [unclassified Mesorhizobium]|uniref:hypothetical protein n=1 Tax=unclassified Mesorhizobium TaxID=325217 RepID=UPI00333AA1F7